MTRAFALALLAASAWASPSLAVQDSIPSRADPRVRIIAYNPMQVTRVFAALLTSTQITFDATETVTHVAIGDSEAWLAQPAGHILFLKPTEGRSTNAQVLTKRANGEVRPYQFELVVRGAERAQVAANGEFVPATAPSGQFAVMFTYPADARAQTVAQRQRLAADSDERRALARLEVDFFYGPRNWRYVAQGSTAIEPAEVSDNGRVTAFRFTGNSPIPTIYAIAADGQETIVPYTMRDDLAVVSTTAAEFRLRFGREVTRVVNLSYDPAQAPRPGTGTTTPEVVRSVRDAAR